MNSIKWIFFDMGYTLVNEDGAHEPRIAEAISELSNLGISVTREQIWDTVYCYGARGSAPVPKAIKHYGLKKVRSYDPNDGEVPYGDARPVLLELKQRYKLGVIANQPLGSCQRLDKYGLLDCFDAVFESAAVGISKPDPRLYMYALETVGCEPDRAVMVGDRSDNDVAPAASVGMHTVRILRGFHKNAPNEPPAEYTIRSLYEMCKIF